MKNISNADEYSANNAYEYDSFFYGTVTFVWTIEGTCKSKAQGC